jgi:hypothetical protein
VIAVRLQFTPASQNCIGKFSSPLNRRSINRRGNSMQLWIGSIENNHSPGRKQACIKPRECRSKAFAGAIAVAQKLRRFGISKQDRSFLNQRDNLVSQSYFTHGSAGQAMARSYELAQ